MKEAKRKKEEMLANEPMFPLILKMSIPMVAAQLVNLLYSIVDRVYIGHMTGVGRDALAGIGITNAIIILISAFPNIVAGGGAPLASIALGEGNRDRAEKIVGNGFFMLLCFSVLTTASAYIVKAPVLHSIGASDVTFPYADSYLSVYLIGTLFVQISIGMENFITAQGRSGYSMICVLSGALINIALDPLFIFALNMGVKGAALATVISQFVSAFMIVSFLVSDKATLRLKVSDIIPDINVILSIFKLGIASFVMVATESFMGFVLNGNLYRYGGDIYVSTLTILQSAMQMMTVPVTGFCTGVTPIISYNYGAGNTKRVRQCFVRCVAVTFSIMFFGALTMIIFPRFIGGLFTDDPILLNMVEKYMPVFFIGITIFGLQRACQTTFVALGQSHFPLFIAVLRKVILLIPLALVLPRFFGLGVMGVYLAEPIADAISAITCTTVFLTQFGKILKKRETKLVSS